MGGTGVALGRDGAAPFLNPAGIVRIEDHRLAFSVNFYSLGITHYSKFHEPGAVDTAQFGTPPSATGVTTNTFRVLPSTLCLFFTIGDLAKLAAPDTPPVPPDRAKRRKLAICFASLESVNDNLQAVQFQGATSAGPTAHVASFSTNWNRTYFGPTYATYLTDRLALGASINGIYSHDTFAIDGSSLSTTAAGSALGSHLGISGSGSSLELTAVVGATYLLSNVTTIGLSVRAPTLHVLGSYTGAYAQSTEATESGSSTVISGTGNYRAPSPMRIAGGLGFEWPKVRLEADAALEVPLASAVSSDVDVTINRLTGTGIAQTSGSESYRVPSHLTVNPSIGLEYFVRSSFSLIGGVGINLSMLDALNAQPSVGNLIQSRTNQATASFGVGTYGDRKELLIGTQFRYGWGEALAVNPYVAPNDWSVVNTQSYSLMFILSGATDLRSIENAVIKIQNAVTTGDPNTGRPLVKPEPPRNPAPAPAPRDPSAPTEPSRAPSEEPMPAPVRAPEETPHPTTN